MSVPRVFPLLQLLPGELLQWLFKCLLTVSNTSDTFSLPYCLVFGHFGMQQDALYGGISNPLVLVFSVSLKIPFSALRDGALLVMRCAAAGMCNLAGSL